MKYKNIKRHTGFTLIELLAVLSIIALLTSLVLAQVAKARSKARKVSAVANIKQIHKALELYYNNNGFFPPDVTRGWDPGLSKRLPFNTYNPAEDCATNLASCVCDVYLSCPGSVLPDDIPSDWITKVQNNYTSQYIGKWPSTTPWGGAYDYNYWNATTTRNGCNVPPGIYLGVQSENGFSLDPATEQEMFNEGIDNDGCPSNGEAQLLIGKIN